MPSPKNNTNVALKVAIVQSEQTQRAIAKRAGMSELRLSQLVTRRLEPTPDDKRGLAKALRCRQSDLFPTEQTSVSA